MAGPWPPPTLGKSSRCARNRASGTAAAGSVCAVSCIAAQQEPWVPCHASRHLAPPPAPRGADEPPGTPAPAACREPFGQILQRRPQRRRSRTAMHSAPGGGGAWVGQAGGVDARGRRCEGALVIRCQGANYLIDRVILRPSSSILTGKTPEPALMRPNLPFAIYERGEGGGAGASQKTWQPQTPASQAASIKPPFQRQDPRLLLLRQWGHPSSLVRDSRSPWAAIEGCLGNVGCGPRGVATEDRGPPARAVPRVARLGANAAETVACDGELVPIHRVQGYGCNTHLLGQRPGLDGGGLERGSSDRPAAPASATVPPAGGSLLCHNKRGALRIVGWEPGWRSGRPRGNRCSATDDRETFHRQAAWRTHTIALWFTRNHSSARQRVAQETSPADSVGLQRPSIRGEVKRQLPG